MIKEYQLIRKNDVWEIVPILEKKFDVTSKWIFKIKNDVDGNIENQMVRFIT